LPRSRQQGELPDRARHGGLLRRRHLGAWPGRGFGEERAARCPYRLHLRRCRRRIRPHGLPADRGRLRLHRAALPVAADDRDQSVRAAGRRRPDHAVRPAGADQYRREPASAADQGHDPAVHILWRLVAAGAGLRYGHAAGADPLASRPGRHAMSAVATPILLAAGGTGGHVFPAEALAAELLRRGHRVGLVTDTRGKGFGQNLPELPLYRIPSGTPSGRSLPGKIAALFEIARGVFGALNLIGLTQPAAVVGFGGYPALPLLLAARMKRVPVLIHEQNAVLGRVNRLVASRADRIATSFPVTRFLPARIPATVTGNPVR